MGTNIVLPGAEPKLARLLEKYGVGAQESKERGAKEEPNPYPVNTPRVDLGDLGDVKTEVQTKGVEIFG